MLADGAVAEQQFDGVGGGDADAFELFGVGGELQQGGDPRAAGEFGVLHEVAAVGLAHDEVGEPEEGDLAPWVWRAGIVEGGLENDVCARQERVTRLRGGGRERGGITNIRSLEFCYPV